MKKNTSIILLVLAVCFLSACAAMRIITMPRNVDLNGYVPETIRVPERNFAMGKFEVTQAEFKHVMGYNKSRNEGNLRAPVDYVDWYEAERYCRRLTKFAREQGIIKNDQEFRLPTLDEWQYVCAAGTTMRYCKGESLRDLLDVAWISTNSGRVSHSVGKKEPNAWGFYDMLGNIWEWADAGDENEELAYFCGGGYNSNEATCSIYEVRSIWKNRNKRYLGFRIVLTNVEK